MFLANTVTAPLATFLATWVPPQYTLTAATLAIWGFMALAIAKCIGRFVLRVKVALSPNAIFAGIIIGIVFVFIAGAGPTFIQNTVYSILPPEIAAQFMAIIGSIGNAAATFNPAAVAAVPMGNEAVMTFVSQVIAIVLMFLPQWAVSVVLLHAYAPKNI
jgi:hypothetical protein